MPSNIAPKIKNAWKQAIEDLDLPTLVQLHDKEPGLLACKMKFQSSHGPMTALQFACMEDWSVGSLWLVAVDPSPSGLLRSKSSALSFAVSGGQVDVVRALLAKDRSNIDTVSEFGNAPLHLAVNEQEPELVSLLLAAGADPLVKNDQGKTALDLAREQEDSEMLEAFLPAISIEQKSALASKTPKVSSLRVKRF